MRNLDTRSPPMLSILEITKYDAPGSPERAAHVQDMLKASGLPCRTDAERGFSHGTFRFGTRIPVCSRFCRHTEMLPGALSGVMHQ